MISTANFKNYRKEEFIGFIKDYLAILSKYDVTAIESQVNDLQKTYDLMIKDYQRQLSSDYTKDIQELDKQRDDCYKGIRGVVKNYLYHYEANYLAAAEALLKSMDKYGKNIANMNYPAQTVALENLLTDWEGDELRTALDLLHLQEWAAKMNSLNEEFDPKRQSRREETAADTSESMDVQRPAVTEAYRKVNAFIGSYNTIAPAENWTNIINEHEAILTEYENLISRRTAKKTV